MTEIEVPANEPDPEYVDPFPDERVENPEAETAAGTEPNA